ncbi:PREDICTED: uncharacterized protein LOC106816206 [Priapulus caudatus]|uniref:Uncharacterized protein LOC106816206 n=1 Tax=Priapulus caudatus TaxID=37621 RepID=A0ABM1EVN3_PRICU|nr:PREDICTED: uncharacterized protein LOC106816206 [Priapulus caudatus]
MRDGIEMRLMMVTVVVMLQLGWVAGEVTCILEPYQQVINGVEGRTAHIHMGQCLSIDRYYIRSELSIAGDEIDFYVAERNCCCKVGSYLHKSIIIGPIRLSYKHIHDCVCSECEEPNKLPALSK